MTTTKFRVAICGGGIGGLTLACILAKYPDVQVDLYEAVERFKEIGAGVMIWERTWKILSDVGLAPEFAKVAHSPPDGSQGVGFDFRKSDQCHEGSRFFLFKLPYGCIRFHRAHFLDVLADALPPGVAHFGKRLHSYHLNDSSGPVKLFFADGSSAECDVLVGCDGLKSTVRQQMFTKEAGRGREDLLRYIEPVFSGTIAYRGLVPVSTLRNVVGQEHRTIESPMMYCGKDKHVVSYSISRGSIVNVVAFASSPKDEGRPYHGPWVADCSSQEVLECYTGWEGEVQELLKYIEKPTRWAIHQLRPLPFYVRERVVLLGDAAHAMTPHQGAGAGQAIEDAYILANILGHPATTLKTITQALSAYERVRLPLANVVLCGSRVSGMMYEFNSELKDHYSQLGPAIEGQWNWLRETTPEGELERALQQIDPLKQRL